MVIKLPKIYYERVPFKWNGRKLEHMQGRLFSCEGNAKFFYLGHWFVAHYPGDGTGGSFVLSEMSTGRRVYDRPNPVISALVKEFVEFMDKSNFTEQSIKRSIDRAIGTFQCYLYNS